MPTASDFLEQMLTSGDVSSGQQVTVKTINEQPFLAVGLIPDTPLKLVFAMPPGTLRNYIRTARLHGRMNATVNGRFSDGSSQPIQTDVLQFDSLTPAVRVVLDSLEAAIKKRDYEASGILANDFVDLFSLGGSLTDDEITGMWGELAFIDTFPEPDQAVSSWHDRLDSRYDFAIQNQRLELKATRGSLRHHTFSSTQLPEHEGSMLTIASLFVEETNGGETIVSLWSRLRERVSSAPIQQKLDRLVLKLIKRDLNKVEESFFDLERAKESIAFYSAENVPQLILAPAVLRATWDASLEDIQPMSLKFLPMDHPLTALLSS